MNRIKKNIFVSLALVGLLSLFFAPIVSAQNVNNFTIESFEADYRLSKTEKDVSTMTVRERIVAVFPLHDQNHGIIRAIPKTYKDNDLDLKIKSITNDAGRKYQYKTNTDNDNLVIKIGDPNKFQHGETAYIIEYSLQNVISFNESQDELYWDVNGDQWAQNIAKVTARVHLPTSIASKLIDEKLCFTGKYGTKQSDCRISTIKNKDETIAIISSIGMNKNETLSSVLGFEKGLFQPDYSAKLIKQIKLVLIVASVIVPPVVALAFIYSRWRKVGRDKKSAGIIIPQYIAPKNLDVIMSDVILSERMNPKTISAAVIELAISKHLVINELKKKGFIKKKTEYELELLGPVQASSPQLQSVIKALFGSKPHVGQKIKLGDKKQTMHTAITSLGKSASKKAADDGYFTVDPIRARRMFFVPGMILLVLGFVATFSGLAAPLGIGLIIAGVIILVGSETMPARTEKGVATRNYLKGLKEYIKLAEVERIKYLQSPDGVKQYGYSTADSTKVKLFEKLLPYAMLFGLEKEWAKEFKDIYQEPPDWYNGNWSTFNAVYLTGSLSGFSTASAMSFSPPGSSSSSGFGGGGFSGGGGGGGGGGGW